MKTNLPETEPGIPSVITHADQLPGEDGVPVRIKGIYIKFDPLPHLKSSAPAWRAGILLEGEAKPQLFIELPRPEGEMEKKDGKLVTISGVFYTQQPLSPGPPEFASRMSGKWIYEADFEG